jgi:Cof subfamily protein (haloacid dehalogenase superfamily)
MAIRLVAVDIDGTLLDSHGLVPVRNRETLAAAAARGIEIAIVTGRRYDFARPILDTLTCPVTAIVCNGALVRLPDGQTPMRHVVPRDIAREILRDTSAWRDGAGLVFDRPREGQVVFERIDETYAARRAYARMNRPFITECEPIEDALTEDPLQVTFNGPVDAMRDLVACLRRHPRAGEVSLAVTEYTSRDFTLVDVLSFGCTKGSMLTEWMHARGYTRDEVMALGDNLNDIEMLEAVGHPVVMGNAVPGLLAKGWPRTCSNDEAGVAEAVERWALGDNPARG